MFKRERLIDSPGIQSKVEIGDYDGVPAVRKVSGEGLSDSELTRVSEAIEPYREELGKAGLNPPDNLDTRRQNDHVVIIDRKVEGETVEQELDNGKFSGLTRMVESIAGSGDTYVDAKGPNFINRGEDVSCVDTFPPMLRDRNGNLEPWVQRLFKRDREMMQFNFGHVRGKATKLLSLAKIQRPDQYNQIKEAVLDILRGRIDKKDYKYIADQAERGCPDMQNMYKHPGEAGRIAREARHK